MILPKKKVPQQLRRDEDVVDHQQGDRQDGRGPEDVEEIRQGREAPLGPVEVGEPVDDAGEGDEGRQEQRQVSEALLQERPFEAHEERRHDGDTPSSARSWTTISAFLRPCRFITLPCPTRGYRSGSCLCQCNAVTSSLPVAHPCQASGSGLSATITRPPASRRIRVPMPKMAARRGSVRRSPAVRRPRFFLGRAGRCRRRSGRRASGRA